MMSAGAASYKPQIEPFELRPGMKLMGSRDPTQKLRTVVIKKVDLGGGDEEDDAPAVIGGPEVGMPGRFGSEAMAKLTNRVRVWFAPKMRGDAWFDELLQTGLPMGFKISTEMKHFAIFQVVKPLGAQSIGGDMCYGVEIEPGSF